MNKYKVVTHHRGRKEWYLNGVIHRVDGPAIIYLDGHESWWLNGEWIRSGPHAGKISINAHGTIWRWNGPDDDWSAINNLDTTR